MPGGAELLVEGVLDVFAGHFGHVGESCKTLDAVDDGVRQLGEHFRTQVAAHRYGFAQHLLGQLLLRSQPVQHFLLDHILQSLLFRSDLSLLHLKSSLPGFAEIRALQHSIWQYLSSISLLLNNLKWSCQKPRISNSYLKVLIPIDWTSEGW